MCDAQGMLPLHVALCVEAAEEVVVKVLEANAEVRVGFGEVRNVGGRARAKGQPRFGVGLKSDNFAAVPMMWPYSQHGPHTRSSSGPRPVPELNLLVWL